MEGAQGPHDDRVFHPRGISWREYADLNVRPVRVELRPKAPNAGEQCEGKSISAPAVKHAELRRC